MFDVILSAITTGNLELSDILVKIDTLWLKGGVDDDQRTQLIDAARKKADPSASYAPLQEQVDKLAADVDALAARVKALEGGGEEPAEEYPAYVQPTGAHDAYYAGDRITWKGKHYICTAPDGVAVVWDPDTYPAYWQVQEEVPEEPEADPGEVKDDAAE